MVARECLSFLVFFFGGGGGGAGGQEVRKEVWALEVLDQMLAQKVNGKIRSDNKKPGNSKQNKKDLHSRVQNYHSKLATALQFPLQKPFCSSSNHKSDRS